MNTPEAPSMPSLALRCRDAEWIDRPQTVAEFDAPAPLPPALRYAGLGEALVADVVARSHFEIQSRAGGRTILSCQMPRYGIPLGVRDLDAPPTDAWIIQETLTGDVLDPTPDGRFEHSIATQLRRGLIAVAGTLPLLVSPVLAHAGDLPPPTAQLEQDAPPPSLPADAAEPAPAPAPSAAPATTAAPATAPSAPPPPRIGGDSLSMTGSALWEGLIGQVVKLELKDGKVLGGTVVAQSAGDLALARASDGMVVAVPKAQVAAIRMRPSTPAAGVGVSNIPVMDRPLHDGRGLHAGGIMLITVGSVLALTGTVFLAISPSYVVTSLPMLLPGLAMIGGGSGMLVAAGKRRKAFNKAWGIPNTHAQLTPTFKASRQGAQGGLVLRF